jgi:glycosyltransferase involved in cell wall biosynthesis
MPYADGASLRRGTLMAGLAHGCAIVTTSPQEPLPELVDGRDLLYVPAEDERATARAVLRIADQPGLAIALRQRARAARAQFRWEEIARQHVHWYRRQISVPVYIPPPP